MSNEEPAELTGFNLTEVPPPGGFLSLNQLLRLLIRYAGLFAFAALVTASALVSFDYLRTRDSFPPNTYLGRLEVSNLSRADALAKLQSQPLANVFVAVVTLESDNQRFEFAPEELGVYSQPSETVNNAFRLIHKDNYLEDLQARLDQPALNAPLILGVAEERLKRQLAGLSLEISSTPKDATVLYYEETGGYHIESEEPGRELDLDKSVQLFKDELYQGKTRIRLSVIYEQPRVTEKVLRAAPPVNRLSAYTTYYGSHDSPNRIHNIRLIASWIDNTLLMPDDVFSLVDTIGEFTPERGFKEAYVIYGGELVPQFGGGSCQIGTTLYNAVTLADVKILQRRNHSFYFNIYPLGRDATVYPGQLDLKFVNDTGYPLLIKSIATNKRLSFRVYGTPHNKKVEFSTVKIFGRSDSGAYVPMTLKQVIDQDIPFQTETTRTVHDAAGQLLAEEKIRSHYKLYGEKSNVPIRRPEAR